MFTEFQIAVNYDDVRSQEGNYYFKDDLLVLSFPDEDFNFVDLHLSYDSLDNDVIQGTVEDVTMTVLAPVHESVYTNYLTYRDYYLGYDYTLTFEDENPGHTDLLLKEPDERINNLKNEVYELSADGYDDVLYFNKESQVWMVGDFYSEPDTFQSVYYTFEDEDSVLYITNVYLDDLVRYTLSYDQVEDGLVEGIIQVEEFISMGGEPPEDFETSREMALNQPYQMMKQDISELTGTTETFYIGESEEPVDVTFEADGAATIEYLGEIFNGTFEFGMTDLTFQVDEDGVITTLYVEDETLTRPDRQQLRPEDHQVTISHVTHELSSEVSDETLENLETLFTIEYE